MSHARGGSIGEGQNVVRKSSKRSRIILGAAVASALAGMTASSVRAVNYSWTGTAGGPSFWDVNTNWSPNSAFPNSGDNAAFGAGALDFNVDLHGVGQNVGGVSFTNATGSYNISNGALAVGGALTQTGAATNTISAPIVASAGWTVSAGTLRITNTSSNSNNFAGNTITVNTGGNLSAAGGNATHGYTNAVNSATVALNGGTFTASSVLVGGTNQLLARWYDSQIDQGDLGVGHGHKFDRLIPNATTGIDAGTGLLNLVPNGYSPFARPVALSDQGQQVGPVPTTDVRNIADGAIINHGDFGMVLTGNLTVTAANAGLWQFATNSDDGSVFYIDLNNNGVFDHTGDPSTDELIVSNNVDQGPHFGTNDGYTNPDGQFRGGTHPNLNLAAGTYKIAVGWFEGRVTGSLLAGFNNAAVGGNPADPNTWRLMDPTDPNQAGMWSWANTGNTAKYNGDYSTTNVSVAAASNSSVVVDGVSAKFGNLTLGAGSTLNVSGIGPATFAATAASGTVTVNNSNRVRTGVISGAITQINKTGAGALVVDDLSGPTGLTAASTISVQAGTFTAKSDGTNSSIGGAKISLAGGTFVAQSTSGIYGFHNYYYAGPNGVSLIDPISNLMALTPSGENGIQGKLSWSDGAEIGDNISSVSGGVLGADNYSVLSRARLHISAANAGTYEFSSTSDDGTTMWIDLNHDGKFTYSTNPADNELIVNNNVYQGPTHRTNNTADVIAGHSGHPNLVLAAGVYDVAFGMYEGGGGSEASYFFAGPATGGAEVQISGNVPGSPASGVSLQDLGTLQEGLWTATDGTLTDANFSASTVGVTADSTLDIFAPSASFGALTIPTGKTLTVTGLGTGSFTQSSLAGTVGINTVADVRTGKIVNGGGLTTINKGGAGALILDDTSAASALTGAMTINASAGTVVGTTDGVNNPLGGAVINLADGAGILLSSKTTTPVTFNNTVGGTGTINVTGATRGNGAVDSGNVTLNALNAAAGSTINLAANNNYLLKIGTVNLAGNATIVNSSSDTNITLGNIAGAASSVININGANRTRITGNITGNNVIINSPGVTFDPGALTTKTSTANTQVLTEMRIASGVIDYGQAVISGNPAHFVAGLWEGRLTNPGTGESDININKSDPNPNTAIQLGLRRINQPNVNTDGGENAGWITGSTYVYTGQIFIPDNATPGDGLGSVSFGENFDDYTQIKVDGQLKIDDAGWNVASTSGPLVLTAGWHDVEFRGGQGVGGVGSAGSDGWPDGFAIGIAFPGNNSNQGGNYVAPVDNGTMNLFRALTPDSGTVDIESGTELKAGGLTQLGAVNLNGQSGLAKLTLNNHVTASNSDVVNINLLGGGSGEVNIGTNTTLTTRNLTIDTSGSTFTKSGPGVLRISGAANLQSIVNISGGKMQFNGTSTGPGGADVQSGAAIGGTGTVSGNVTVETGGSLSPHDGTGVATLTISDSLTMNPLSKMDFNFGGTGDSVNVLNNLTLSGNTSLNINAITGFTVGTYRLFTMTNFSDTGDIVVGTNNGPAAFTYSIVETAPNGAIPGHIDLIVTTTNLKWTGTTNNVWDINNTVNWATALPGQKYIDLTAVTFDNTGLNRNINITVASVNPASITVNNDAAHNYSIGGNPIAGATGVLKQGVGDLTLTGSNTYIGPVIVEAGSLTVNALANAGVASPLGQATSPVTLGSANTAGTLVYSGGVAGSTDRGITLAAGGGTVNAGAAGATFGGIVSGAGDLTKTGAGTLSLSGTSNTNTGSITVSAGTLSVGSMGIGASPAVITLGSGTTFDYGGGTQTGGRGVNTPTSGATGTFRVSNAATNLTLTGAVGGQTINKAGPGTLTLAGTVTFTGTSHNLNANSGTLALTGTGNSVPGTFGVDSGSTLRVAPGAVGTSVTLNGGTLALAGPSSQGGLNGEFYQFGPFQAMLNSSAAFNAELANHQPPGATANTSVADQAVDPNVRGAINNNAGNGNPFSQYNVDIGSDNIVGHWKGTLNVDAAHAGLATLFTASDDGSVLWVDGQMVVNNNFFQGVTERSGQINLAEGAHTVELGFYEGGGGAGMIWRWLPNNGGKEVVPNNVLSSGSANWGNNVSVVAGTTSTISGTAAAVANLGSLNLGNNSTLRVGGGIAVTGTTLATAGGTYNINGGWDANLGSVTGSGTINHSGIGKLILETNNTAGPGAGSAINLTGGTLGLVGDSGSTNPLGSASVSLGNGSGILIGARNGDVTINSPVSASGNVRIGSGVVGSATAGAHTLTLGSAANPVTLAAGASVDFTANDGTSLVLPAVQQAGDASYSNSSLEDRPYVTSQSNNIRIGNINALGSATFQGNREINVTGNIGGGVTNVISKGGALNIDPGGAGTSNIGSNVKVVTILNAKSGTTSLGNNIISGQKASTAVAGINEYFANGDFYEGAIAGRPNTYNVPDSIQLAPRRANQQDGGTNGNPPGQGGNAPGWTDHSTYIYQGQILVPDNGPLDGFGDVAFYFRFDDSISLKIDGQTIMRDTSWNNATSSGQRHMTAGWHDIEMRFGEGQGGVGPNNGWAAPPPNQFADGTYAAVGFQVDPNLGFDGDSSFNGNGDFNGTSDVNKYIPPRDNGSMNMLRIADVADSGVVNVSAGATLNAGGLNDLQGLNIDGGGTVNLNNSASHTGNVIRLSATGAPTSANTVNLGANNTLNLQELTVAEDTIFNKNGAGTLRITGLNGVAANAFPIAHVFSNNSVVNVNAGKLIVNSAGRDGTGSVNVNSGATLGGTGSILGGVTVNANGHVAPGDGGIGTLTVGALSLTSSRLDIEAGAAGLDQIKSNPDTQLDLFTLSGNNIITLGDLGGAIAGDYVIIDQNNLTPVPNAQSFFSISNPHLALSNLDATIGVDGNNDIILHLAPGVINPQVQWNVDASGSWGVASNWNPQTVPDAPNAIANFLGIITAPRTVTLDGNRTVQDLNFDNANKYTIASGTGGTLTINAGTITVTSGSHEISAAISLTGAVTKAGPGTLTISGAQSNPAGSSLTVAGGTVNLNSNPGGGTAATSNLSLNITGSKVVAGANLDLKELNVAFGNPGTQTLDLASPPGAGQFHQVQVFSANLAAAKVSLYNALVNANAAGAIDPLDGITDSGLHGGAKIGLALLGDHITIRPVRVGDLNLDGTVTISDFIDLASNFNTVGTATWQEGDLNYDRNVSISDFIDLAANFNGSYAGGAGAINSEDVQTLASFAQSIGVDPSIIGSAVPEPGTLSLLAIGAMGLMSRRRRKA